MKKLVLIAVSAAVVSAGIWKFRQAELNSLRAGASLEKPSLPTVGAGGRNPVDAAVDVDPAELKRLRAAQLDLARWRGTVSSLRQQTNQTPEEIEVQASKTRAEAGLIRALHASGERSKQVREKLGFAQMLVIGLAGKTDGSVPASWEEVGARLNQTTRGKDPMLDSLKNAFDQDGSSARDLAGFEILPVPAGTKVLFRKPPPALPVLRERQTRAQPDGSVCRFYGWLNHHMEEVRLPDGNFAAWEAEHFRPGVARTE